MSGLDFPRVAAIVVALAGCYTDMRTRRIPNVLTFGAAAGALGYSLSAGGLTAMGWSAVGWVVGAAMFFPFFALGGIGGGDVKLMAALGAWLGPGPAVWLALFAALAGGPLALVLAFSRGYARQAFGNLWGLLSYWRVAGLKPHPGLTLESAGKGVPRLPYALPITVGLLVTLWLH
jgi:prepilin peptidase CpaA